ncbi:nicotinate-nucleotide--dimethylbenzimidazole phosphoribosyltransferase [Streptomyces pinistramenti]|uniref:nicotinate-nucleotide--dimethylbenzimidazole phosphoribosyltransferase n=1 Tax=Streptomyces pinistramenti TaxID=2884812 RepID=UPI001D07CBB7|nr:nicotinate-nucleotide--dimethylbenzimidazole phosphoribosyltransferase [Streptomyces pinistramenti]MCB5911083.1 nicotinate-nucleotide--dimethylbenzimidazole phosphoribosyltransferase [Streptomyces pinistramenti]
MTDTGQVPGEGLPENAGGHPGQPQPAAVPSPAGSGPIEQGVLPPADAYPYVDPVDAVADDDLLLMPGAQGAWSEHQAPQPSPQPQAAAPAPQEAAAGAQLPAQAGDHESGGRDTGSVDFEAVRLQQAAPQVPAAAQPAPPRRPLHMGPPVPDATGGVVRSLADRGPAHPPQPMPVRQPGPPTVGPEYLDVHEAGPATEAPAGPEAVQAYAGQPRDAAHDGRSFGPQAQGLTAYGAPGGAPLPGPQLGEIPSQAPPWGEASAQAVGLPVAETVGQGGTPDGAAAPQNAQEPQQTPDETVPQAAPGADEPAAGSAVPQSAEDAPRDLPESGTAPAAPDADGATPAQVAPDTQAQPPQAPLQATADPVIQAAPEQPAAEQAPQEEPPAADAPTAAADAADEPAPQDAELADPAQPTADGTPAAPEDEQAAAAEPSPAEQPVAQQPPVAVGDQVPEAVAVEAVEPPAAEDAGAPAEPSPQAEAQEAGQAEEPTAYQPADRTADGTPADADEDAAGDRTAPDAEAAPAADVNGQAPAAAEPSAAEAQPEAAATPEETAVAPNLPEQAPAEEIPGQPQPADRATDAFPVAIPVHGTPAVGTPIDGWPGNVPAAVIPAPGDAAPDDADGPAPQQQDGAELVQLGEAEAEAAPQAEAEPQTEAADQAADQAPDGGSQAEATAPAAADETGTSGQTTGAAAETGHPDTPAAPPADAQATAPTDEAAPAPASTPQDAPADDGTVPAPASESAPLQAPATGYDESERAAVHRVMRERRDIRNGFRSDPIPNDVLLRVLEAAHTAPSVGHSQPWDFVVIRSDETRERMHQLAMDQRDAYAKSLPKARAKQFRELKIEAILDTPVNIVVTADPTRGGRHTLGRHTQPQMAPYSSALAVENLWLAARAEGLGVGWVSFFDERGMVRELGLPEHLEVVAYLCVGYVDEFPDEPELMQAGWAKRRPLSWVVHEETYGRRALPGEDPHDLLQETLHGIRPLDAKALGEAWERQKRMTKPAGALGMLEIISAQLCGLSRKCPPPIPEPAAVAIFAGDHGVHAQGVTPWPQEVTGQMVANFLGGGAVCNAFANQVGAEVCIVDVGVAAELPATPGLLPRKVRPGTADFTVGPAMSHEDVLKAIEAGIETARDLVAAGNKALLTGEMGIANTTASAALISVYTDADPAEVTGRGTGINDETHTRKVEVVRRALELHQPDPADPIGVLAAVGGLEHAALVGLILGGASLRTPVILDGVSAGAAALVARAIAPEALAACIAGHRSAEPGHVAALTKLGLRPLVDLDLRLGEGTGALLALPIVQSAARAMHEVATFDSAGVTEKG